MKLFYEPEGSIPVLPPFYLLTFLHLHVEEGLSVKHASHFIKGGGTLQG